MTATVDGPARRLALADLDDCLPLAKDRGWPSEERKWRFLFGVGEVLGIDAPDGDGLAGTVIVTRYQGSRRTRPGWPRSAWCSSRPDTVVAASACA